MAKNQRRKVSSKLAFQEFTKYPDIHFDWDNQPVEAFEGFPIPPFVSWMINTDRVNSFCRSIFNDVENMVWIGKDDIIHLLESFQTESVQVQANQQFFFCSSSHPEYLLKIKGSIDLSKTIFVILGRKFDELDLIKFIMDLSQEKKVFIGPDVGIMSEYARFLFIPFYPIETENCRFWHHSELIYLPLHAMGLPIKEMIQGMKKVFLHRENRLWLLPNQCTNCKRRELKGCILSEILFQSSHYYDHSNHFLKRAYMAKMIVSIRKFFLLIHSKGII